MSNDLKSPLGTAADFPGVTRLATHELSAGRHAIDVVIVDPAGLPPTGAGKSTTLDDLADITLTNGGETLLVAADATRREAIMVADTANTVAIRIGKTGQVGAARGVPLQPGQPIVLTTTAAIYGFAGAAGQKVAITLIKD